MTAFDEWLAGEVLAREGAGLTRRLAPRPDDRIDLAGNDYLGFSRHPKVIAGAVVATERYGAGAGASRLVTGTLEIHDELERALADFTGMATGLVFSTGYHANLSILSALADSDTLVVSDAHIHASMIDACRLARVEVQVVPHSDVDAVSALLRTRTQRRAIVLAESIYSVLGDAAPLVELLEVCAAHDALLVVDEAHGLGVVGDGHGLAHGLGLVGDPRLLLTATLSKALGAQGGVVLGPANVREQLINRARPFIYDTGLAPGASGAALAAVGVLNRKRKRVARVNDVAARLADAAGVARPAGAVLAVEMPSPQAAVAAVERAASAGVLIGCFRPPSTPDGISRLRMTAHADLSDDRLAHALAVVEEVAR